MAAVRGRRLDGRRGVAEDVAAARRLLVHLALVALAAAPALVALVLAPAVAAARRRRSEVVPGQVHHLLTALALAAALALVLALALALRRQTPAIPLGRRRRRARRRRRRGGAAGAGAEVLLLGGAARRALRVRRRPARASPARRCCRPCCDRLFRAGRAIVDRWREYELVQGRESPQHRAASAGLFLERACTRPSQQSIALPDAPVLIASGPMRAFPKTQLASIDILASLGLELLRNRQPRVAD